MGTRRIVGAQALPSLEERQKMDRDIELAEEEEANARKREQESELTESLTEEVNSIEDELRAMTGAKIKVYKKSNAMGSGGYLFSVQSDEVSFDELVDRIRNDWGGGQFRIRVYDGNRLKLNRDIEVLEPLRREQNSQQQGGERSELSSILIEMQRSNQRASDELRNFMLQQAQTQSAMLMDVLKSERGAPVSGGGPLDIVQLVTLVKTLIPEPPKSDPFEHFMRGLEFGKENSGGGEGESVLQTAIKALGQPLVDMVQAGAFANMQKPQPIMPQNPQVNNQQQLMPPQQAAIQAESAQQNQNNSGGLSEAQMIQILRQWQPYIQILANAAAQEAEPMVYAELLLDQVPMESLELIVLDERNYEQIFVNIPALVQFRQWFDALRQAVLELRADDLNSDRESDAGLVTNGVHGQTERTGSANISGEPAIPE